MEITWLGHSCFRLRSGELALLTDPFPESLGLSMGQPQAVAVTISHDHPHHSYWQGVEGDPKVIRGPGEYELHGIYIKGVLTPPGEGDPPTKRNTAYLLEMDNLNLCHPGDIGRPLPTGLVEELSPTDVLFVPVGGVCTLKVPQVVELIQALNPKVVIPMHYQLPGLGMELGPLDPFLREMGIKEPQVQNRLNVTPSSLPQETRVVVLQPALTY